MQNFNTDLKRQKKERNVKVNQSITARKLQDLKTKDSEDEDSEIAMLPYLREVTNIIGRIIHQSNSSWKIIRKTTGEITW